MSASARSEAGPNAAGRFTRNNSHSSGHSSAAEAPPEEGPPPVAKGKKLMSSASKSGGKELAAAATAPIKVEGSAGKPPVKRPTRPLKRVKQEKLGKTSGKFFYKSYTCK